MGGVQSQILIAPPLPLGSDTEALCQTSPPPLGGPKC